MGETIFDKAPEHSHKEPVYGPEQAERTSKAFEEILETRRSVRIFDGTPVPPAIVKKCLRAAMLAPNSSNLQPWEFYWVRSKDKKDTLVRACLSQPAAKTADQLIVLVARTKTWNKNRLQMLDAFSAEEKKGEKVPASAKEYYQKLIPLIYSFGPFGILGPIKRLIATYIGFSKPMAREPVSLADLKLWATKSTTLAAENLMLAFRAYGYDSCPMEGFDSVRVKKLLNLPTDAYVVMVVSAGKRASNGVYGSRIRFDESQFVFEV